MSAEEFRTHDREMRALMRRLRQAGERAAMTGALLTDAGREERGEYAAVDPVDDDPDSGRQGRPRNLRWWRDQQQELDAAARDIAATRQALTEKADAWRARVQALDDPDAPVFEPQPEPQAEPEPQVGSGVVHEEAILTDVDRASFREDMNGLSSVINMQKNRRQRWSDKAETERRERLADAGKRRTTTVAYGLPFSPLFRSYRDY